jgi:hypothetical protein
MGIRQTILGPGDDPKRLSFLIMFIEVGIPHLRGKQRAQAEGMAYGLRFRREEIQYNMAGSPRGWRECSGGQI